jgi:hypothetical protein
MSPAFQRTSSSDTRSGDVGGTLSPKPASGDEGIPDMTESQSSGQESLPAEGRAWASRKSFFEAVSQFRRISRFI